MVAHNHTQYERFVDDSVVLPHSTVAAVFFHSNLIRVWEECVSVYVSNAVACVKWCIIQM